MFIIVNNEIIIKKDNILYVKKTKPDVIVIVLTDHKEIEVYCRHNREKIFNEIFGQLVQ